MGARSRVYNFPAHPIAAGANKSNYKRFLTFKTANDDNKYCWWILLNTKNPDISL